MSLLLRGTIAGFHRLLGNKRGTAAVEYAIVASGIGVAILATVWNVGAELRSTYYDKLSGMF